jgi:hypothetical protein
MAKTSSSGIGFGSLLFLLFLGLKLTNNIDWSWWWVTAPLWLPFSVGVVIIGTIGLISELSKR